jgi:PAS domain S-box-containing protein
MDLASLVPEALLRSEAEAIIATDRDGVVRLWTPGAVRLFGFDAAEVVGQSLDLIIPEQLQGRHWAGFRTVMKTGVSRYGAGDILAVPARTKEGRRISVEFTVAMLRDEADEPVGMVAVLRDVSVRFEEVRALRRKLAELAGRNEAPAP